MARTTESSAVWDGAPPRLVHRSLAVILVAKRGLPSRRGQSR